MKVLKLLLIINLIAINIALAQSTTKDDLCKKWELNKYRILWKSYEPNTDEKNDYIWLKENMTYESVDEGKYSTGKWAFNTKEDSFVLYDANNQGLKFEIEEIGKNKLVLRVDNKELEGVNIHFINREK